MLKINFINETEMDELCRFVCRQLKASGSRRSDIEALYFGVYWQMCVASRQRVRLDSDFDFDSGVNKLRRLVADLITEPSDFLRIVDENVNASLDRLYIKSAA